MQFKSSRIDIPSELLEKRCIRIAQDLIATYKLDLRGLKILTEAASGNYRYTPLICAMAGAEKVFAIARESKWGSKESVAEDIESLSKSCGQADKISVIEKSDFQCIGQCDIITNSGMVRPIDAEMVSQIKTTAVIPLMWETWEFRPEEVDLSACKEKGILVLGTDEEKIGFARYPGQLMLKLLNDCGLEVYHNRLFIISSIRVGRAIREVMYNNEAEFKWTSFDSHIDSRDSQSFIPPEDTAAILDYISGCDALICDERYYQNTLIGTGGILTARQIKKVNDHIILINRSGAIDYSAIKSENIFIYPDQENRYGFPNVTSSYLGPRPVLELIAAGINVGQMMARLRLAGWSVGDAAYETLCKSFAQDFPGEFRWAT